MIKHLDAQAKELEDEYLDKTLSRFGNVFNGWNQIKTGGTGVAQGFGSVASVHTSVNKAVSSIQGNKRVKKVNEKEKDKEKIYMLSMMEEKT